MSESQESSPPRDYIAERLAVLDLAAGRDLPYALIDGTILHHVPPAEAAKLFDFFAANGHVVTPWGIVFGYPKS